METTCVIQEPQKKQKLKEEQDIDVNGKSLGNLPEEFLKHILSFLPTKDAVRTSVLSKRWEFLWASIPNLDFELLRQVCFLKGRKKHFMNFVDRVLCLRDSDIKRFTLCCDILLDAFRLHTWISAIVKHNVQELYMKLDHYQGVLSVPYKTLTSLHLDIDCLLNLPSSTCFSNLKILTFANVTFLNERLTQQLFSGLQVLEKLELHECVWTELEVVRICAPKLHFLRIVEIRSNREGCKIMIFGVSLKEFYCRGLLINDYCLCESFSLEKAEIDADSYLIPTRNFCRTYRLLTGLSNVKFLRLSSDLIQVPRDATYLLPRMPMFSNLMDLIFVKYSIDLGCIELLKTLQKSPRLKTLNFFGGINLSLNLEEDDRIMDPVPPCFLSHLKCIKVRKYDGHAVEFFAVKILLKNAVVLDEIIITFSEHLARNLQKQVKVSKQLLELPRGSQNCKIVLE